MGQFINSDCNTWKASRPSPHCCFMAAHKRRPSSTTVAATTVIKINTAVAGLLLWVPLICYLRRGEISGSRASSQKMKVCYILGIKVGYEYCISGLALEMPLKSSNSLFPQRRPSPGLTHTYIKALNRSQTWDPTELGPASWDPCSWAM